MWSQVTDERRRRPAPGRDRRVQRRPRAHQAGAGDHAGEVRDLVQPHRVQPGGRARARLQGRHGADQPRRHRDGPGPAHEDAAGGGDRARRAAVAGAAGADAHRQGAQHVGHRGELRRRPQRRRGEERLRADPGPPRRRGRRGSSGCTRTTSGSSTASSPASPTRTRTLTFAEVVHLAYYRRVQLSAAGFYRTAGLHWDAKNMHGEPFKYFAYGAAASEVEVDGFTGAYTAAARRHRARRRRQPLPAGRPRPGRGRLRAGRGLAHARGPALGHVRRPQPRAAVHPGGQHVQAAELLGDADGVPGHAAGAGGRGRRGVWLQGGRRAAADAGVQRAGGAAGGRGGVRAPGPQRRPGLPVDAGGRVLGGGGRAVGRAQPGRWRTADAAAVGAD